MTIYAYFVLTKHSSSTTVYAVETSLQHAAKRVNHYRSLNSRGQDGNGDDILDPISEFGWQEGGLALSKSFAEMDREPYFCIRAEFQADNGTYYEVTIEKHFLNNDFINNLDAIRKENEAREREMRKLDGPVWY